jgi:hypothetical protein
MLIRYLFVDRKLQISKKKKIHLLLLISYFVDYSSEMLMNMIINDKVVINYHILLKSIKTINCRYLKYITSYTK